MLPGLYTNVSMPWSEASAVQGFRCWVKQPLAGNDGSAPTATTPIVFIHGVGLGVVRVLSLPCSHAALPRLMIVMAKC